MKSALNKDAISAIAHAALVDIPRKAGYNAEWNQPDRVACGLLGVGDASFAKDRDFSLALAMYEAGFGFALQLGARIGADPLHAPEVKDLIALYRLEQEDAA